MAKQNFFASRIFPFWYEKVGSTAKLGLARSKLIQSLEPMEQFGSLKHHMRRFQKVAEHFICSLFRVERLLQQN